MSGRSFLSFIAACVVVVSVPVMAGHVFTHAVKPSTKTVSVSPVSRSYVPERDEDPSIRWGWDK